ncbi:MAG TPA: hypothetical protein DCR40_18120 [Prolixibacteraceae bacterium]|nr:hypothetical protein [Prolixibacteraceae bacterium]
MEKRNEKQATNLQVVELNHQKFAVELQNGNMSINLTQMSQPFGRSKRPLNWLITQESKDYLNALSVAKKIATAELVKVKQGGQNQGTWVTDYRIAMRFAQWLSPEFSIAVDEILVNLLRGDALLVKPFNGVEPTIHQGKSWYNYLDVLVSLGYSRNSGSVAVRKRLFPQHFAKLFGRNFITPVFCNFLKSKKDAVQLVLDFTANHKVIGGLS